MQLNFWIVSPSFSLLVFSKDSREAKLSTTKNWRAIETEKKTQQRKIMSNYVKLK